MVELVLSQVPMWYRETEAIFKCEAAWGGGVISSIVCFFLGTVHILDSSHQSACTLISSSYCGLKGRAIVSSRTDSEGRAMGAGCRAGAQVPRRAGRTGQRQQRTDACAARYVELDPTRPRLQPVPAPQEPATGGDQAERCAAGPGGGAESLCSGIAHYLEDPKLPEALGRAASRKPKHPGAAASLSSAGSESGSTRAPWGRDTVPGQMPAGIPALSLPTTNLAAAPRGVCPPPPPLPTRTFPKKRDSRGMVPSTTLTLGS